MRRKALKGLSNTLCHMVDGDGRYPDDPRLAALGSGILVIDALPGTATHDGRPVKPPLALPMQMRAWLMAELARLGLETSDVVGATATVTYRHSR